jgi:hypothetical protein
MKLGLVIVSWMLGLRMVEVCCIVSFYSLDHPSFVVREIEFVYDF